MSFMLSLMTTLLFAFPTILKAQNNAGGDGPKPQPLWRAVTPGNIVY